MADRPQAAGLLRQHPALEQWLRTEWNRPVKDYRVYWDNKPPVNSPSAEHIVAPEHQLIVIHVSQKLCPVDQLLTLSYEICNAQGHCFDEVTAQAAAGKITREEYINEIDKREYAALLRIKECFPKLLPLTNNEVATTTLYKLVLETPDEFQEYQAWCNRRHDPNRARNQELYGRQYDQLVNKKNKT